MSPVQEGGAVGIGRGQEALILLRCAIEETDGDDVALAIMRLSTTAAVEYHQAIQAMRAVSFSGTPLGSRALWDFEMTATQRHDSSIPWPCYLPNNHVTDHSDFWGAVAQVREAEDYCAVALPVSLCPRDEELLQVAEGIPVDGTLTLLVHPLGVTWTGRTNSPASDLTIGDLPRHLVEDLANGAVKYGVEYWERE